MNQSALFDIQTLPDEIYSFLGPIQQFAYPPQGDTSIVAVVDAAHGRYVVKRSRGEQFSSWIQREYTALQTLIQSPLPTPYPHVFVQREVADEIEAWLVMSYLFGDPVIVAVEHESEPEARVRILRAFGNALSTIHRYAVSADLYSPCNLAEAKNNLLHYSTEGSAELLAYLQQHQPVPVPFTFIHGDFTVDNVLISEGKVTGIIDWAGGGIGDPRYDLALAIRPKKTGLFQTLQDRQAFFEGYGLSDLSEADYEYFISLYEFF